VTRWRTGVEGVDGRGEGENWPGGGLSALGESASRKEGSSSVDEVVGLKSDGGDWYTGDG
jgi:hypothetical protein